MNFERFFKFASYAAVFCGFLALWVSGTFGAVGSFLFVAAFAAAWFLDGTRWQIPERAGTALIVLAVPLYYLGWRFRFFDMSGAPEMLPGMLARLILSLTAIKLLQRKSDRDWIFLYLMAFFQVLLGAGLSISPLYFGVFLAYAFLMVCVTVLFEIRKTSSLLIDRSADHQYLERFRSSLSGLPVRRVPLTALALIISIILLAGPVFFMLPRSGQAGSGAVKRGISASSGFSDTVTLGGIGRIQENDAVVMRIRVENTKDKTPFMRWRGVALDTFDNRSWSRPANESREVMGRGDRDLIQVGYASGREGLVLQTVFLEPLDAPVIFGLPVMVGVQGGFPVLYRDSLGAIFSQRANERVSYRVLSDVSRPPAGDLRRDNAPYDKDDFRFLQLPDKFDPRIADLASDIIRGTTNRFDAARALETYFHANFGYTLDQKAGGDEPLADFLFNVREGHCEYFATAMAVMLRTQGIATRVVNGFQQGEYNEAADAYVVRQRNAHSWVEVYFPGQDVWVPFDPTPPAGQNLTPASNGIAGSINKYLEALEMIWIQYFVAFDSQEQRSLFTSIRRGVSDYNTRASAWAVAFEQSLKAWWQDVKGDRGLMASFSALGYAVAVLAGIAICIFLLVWLSRAIVRSRFWRDLMRRLRSGRRNSIVEFYERMERVLASKGIARQPHQTPLEFAYASGLSGVVQLTEKYNRVRFGDHALSSEEAEQIEVWLSDLSTGPGLTDL